MRGLYFLLLAGILGSCLPAPGEVLGPPATPTITAYFTDPGQPEAQGFRGGPDEALAEAVDGARVSVDAAVHDLNLWRLRDALLDAHRRGVAVRLVVEGDNLALRPELQELLEAGIPIVEDTSAGLMHNKFVVIDRHETWTGSMNFTTNGAYVNRNDLLRLVSADVAAAYTAEFEEMFNLGLFGAESPESFPSPRLAVGEAQVAVRFAPEDAVLAQLVALVNAAEGSVYFLAYSFTAEELAEAMGAAQRRGVELRGVLDRGQTGSNTGGVYETLLAAGIDVRLDGEAGSLHNKLIIIDEAVVVTGSYNFSRNAEQRNDENLLVIWDAELAAQYEDEFWAVWDSALGVP